ncbi:hypothetical protein [Sphingobacterium deserti]|nr:hypothetical protein [Sphingobacterium deserti]
MRKIRIYRLCTILIVVTGKIAPAQTSYLLFDKDKLTGYTKEGVPYRSSYVDISSSKSMPKNLTIYNYLFKSETGNGVRLDNRTFYKGWKDSQSNLNRFPSDILISITPLTKTYFKMVDVSKEVKEGSISFDSNTDLLSWAVKDLYFAIYSPLGIFDHKEVVNTKRTDIRLVIKEANRYLLIDDETLTELYYLDNRPVSPVLKNMCSIVIGSENHGKAETLAKLRNSTGNSWDLYGKILKDTTIKMVSKDKKTIRIQRFWTNGYVIPFTSQTKNRGIKKEWFVKDGIGDFEFLWGIGVINGNFLDFFMEAKPNYSPDKSVVKMYKLNFKTKRINGVPFEKFLSNHYYQIL